MNAHVPATQRTIVDLIEEYNEKVENVDTAIAAYEQACKDIEMAGTIMGTYVSPVLRGRAYVSANEMRKNLLQSGWKAIYNRLNIDMIASANDKRLFERTIADPPALTADIVRSTFAHYYSDPRKHILRGLAEVFAGLDPAFRSHAKVKIGVKGLPKRVILHSVGAWGNGHSSYGRDQLRDILNALATYQGKPLLTYPEIALLLEDGEALRHDSEKPDPTQSKFDRERNPKMVKIIGRDIWLKRYSNGNGHLYFGPDALLDINRGLAEFYGDVLPDVDPDQPERAPSTAVAKDLQFYWTPDAVIARTLEFANVPNISEWRHPMEPIRVLEPSCGDGRILDAIRKYGHKGFGIEYHGPRADQARAKGHSVLTANFLECPPKEEFDAVVMNPPFYGRHYAKHVNHALMFLKPGGVLVSILPASAFYDHGELDGEWRDLPVASFSEAGTNVPTGMLKIRKPK